MLKQLLDACVLGLMACGADLCGQAVASATENATSSTHPFIRERFERCAAYSLAACMSAIQVEALSVEEIDKGCGSKGSQTSLEDCNRFAHRCNLSTAAFRWKRLPLTFNLEGAPAILPVVVKGARGHFVAAVGVRNNQLLIIDYPFPPMWVSDDDLRSKWHWDGTMLHVARNSAALQTLTSLAIQTRLSTFAISAGILLIVVGGGWFALRHRLKVGSCSKRAVVTRAGFTVVELLVSLAVMSLLVALILPAVQSAREAARRATCKNHLHQIGVSLEAFHTSHGRYPAGSILSSNGANNLSPHVELLPFLDQQPLYELFNRNEAGSGVNQDPPLSQVNADLLPRGLDVFACPSDDASQPRCNYRISSGTSPGMHETIPKSTKAALQGYRSLLGRSDATFRDGNSHTAAFAEKLSGDRNPGSYTPWRDSVLVSIAPPNLMMTPDDALAACRRPAKPKPVHFSFGGMTWVLSGYPQTWYNHVLPPNSKIPDCAAGGPAGLGAFTARSLHPGGVNVLFADGSVRFTGSGIDLDVWRALGTVDGNEIIPQD